MRRSLVVRYLPSSDFTPSSGGFLRTSLNITLFCQIWNWKASCGWERPPFVSQHWRTTQIHMSMVTQIHILMIIQIHMSMVTQIHMSMVIKIHMLMIKQINVDDNTTTHLNEDKNIYSDSNMTTQTRAIQNICFCFSLSTNSNRRTIIGKWNKWAMFWSRRSTEDAEGQFPFSSLFAGCWREFILRQS